MNPANTPGSELASYLSLSSFKTLELAQSDTKTEEELETPQSELKDLELKEKAKKEDKGKSAESREKRKADELLGLRRRRSKS